KIDDPSGVVMGEMRIDAHVLEEALELDRVVEDPDSEVDDEEREGSAKREDRRDELVVAQRRGEDAERVREEAKEEEPDVERPDRSPVGARRDEALRRRASEHLEDEDEEEERRPDEHVEKLRREELAGHHLGLRDRRGHQELDRAAALLLREEAHGEERRDRDGEEDREAESRLENARDLLRVVRKAEAIEEEEKPVREHEEEDDDVGDGREEERRQLAQEDRVDLRKKSQGGPQFSPPTISRNTS